MADDLQTKLAALTNEQAQLRAAALLHGLSGLLLDKRFSVAPLRALMESASDPRDTRAGMLASDEEYMLRAVVNALEGK
jgi:hypothetical protein